jgi:hypothetical protein
MKEIIMAKKHKNNASPDINDVVGDVLKTLSKDDKKNIDEDLERMNQIFYEYRKQKSCNVQVLTSFIAFVLVYWQQHVIKNSIEVGIPTIMLYYIGIAAVIVAGFGWLGHYLEFHVVNENIYKKGKVAIWIIEIIMVIIFLVLMFTL